MKEYIIYKQIVLSNQHIDTGKTQHIYKNKLLPRPKKLLIVSYPGVSGYYLLHLDQHNQDMTDTFHETLEDALEQAKWEYDIKEKEWETFTNN